MHYELTGERGAGGRLLLLRERRSPAQAEAGRRRDFYAEADDHSGAHPVTAEAERRVRGLREGRARFRRLLALSEHFAGSGLLPDAARQEWLDLEEQLHAHWLAVAAEHYNLGVTAGLQRAATYAHAPNELPPLDRVRALADALRAAIDEL